MTTPGISDGPTDQEVRLRLVERDDLPLLFEYQQDPAANRMAFTRPRSASEFDAHWAKILQDPQVIVRAIVAKEVVVGSISCFEYDGRHYVGYWIGNRFWGRGIASRALRLLLHEVSIRPLYSRVADSNVASIGVLKKCGFQEIGREWSPASERFVACEEVVMELAD